MFGNYIEEYINNLRQDRDLRGDSTRWANWMSKLLPNTCKFCVDQHGRIVDISVLNNKDEVEAHRNCKCLYVPMRTKNAGEATDLEEKGADFYIAYFGYLPDYYGGNWDAFWDCLTDMYGDPIHIEIIGLDVVEKKFGDSASKMVEILRRFKHFNNDLFSDSIKIEIVSGDVRISLQ